MERILERKSFAEISGFGSQNTIMFNTIIQKRNTERKNWWLR
jgi:hypothetical protein